MSIGIGIGLRHSVRAAGGGGWTPAALNDTVLWLTYKRGTYQDAARTTVAGIGDPVGGLVDQSGNGAHATAASTARPTLTADGLQFNGSSNIMRGLFASSLSSRDLFFAVAVKVTTATRHQIFALSRSPTDTEPFKGLDLEVYADASPDTITLHVGDGTLTTSAAMTTQDVTGLDTILGFWRSNNGATFNLQINGGANNTQTPTNFLLNTDDYMFGGRGASQWLTGLLYEIIVISPVPDAATRSQIYSYLAGEHDINLA